MNAAGDANTQGSSDNVDAMNAQHHRYSLSPSRSYDMNNQLMQFPHEGFEDFNKQFFFQGDGDMD